MDTVQFHQLITPARIFLNERNYEKGKIEAEKALSTLQQKSGYLPDYESATYGILGDCSMGLQQWTSAQYYYEKGLEVEGIGPAARSDLLNKLGHLYVEIKDFDRATTILEESLAMRQNLYGSQDLLVSDVLNNLGISYLYIGDLLKALNYQQQAFRIRSGVLPVDDMRLAQTYNNLAQCFDDLGDEEQAIYHYNEALRRYSDDPLWQRERADVLLNLGNLYFSSDDYNQARRYYKESLSNYGKVNDLDGQAICWNNLGNIEITEDHPHQALIFLEKARQLRIDLYGQVHPEVAESWYNIGYLYRLNDQLDLALESYEQCLIALNFDNNREDKLEQVSGFQTLLSALYLLADVHYVKYLRAENPASLHEALDHLEKCDEVLDFLRIRYDALGSKLNLVSIGHEVYEFAINILFELKKVTGEARFWHRAFHYSEKSKGLLLLDGLYRSKARAFGDVPESVLNEIDNLERELADLEQVKYQLQSIRVDNREQQDSVENILFLKRDDFDRTLQKINTNYPKYYQLRYENPMPSIPGLQQGILDTNETLIEYFIGNDITIFVINRDQFDAIKVPVNADFQSHLDTIVPLIRRFPFESTVGLKASMDAYVTAARRLYQYLIAPIERQLKTHLIIVPDDKLGYLPFDALLTEPVDSVDLFRDHPYLIRKHSLSYGYSASLLQELETSEPKKVPTRYLGFAPEFSGMKSEGLNELLFNRDEIVAANKILGGEIYLGQEATKANFIKQQTNFGIIHLATHGKVNRGEDDFSFLAFSKLPNSERQDYFLYVNEIYNLPIKAQLIILSACETGTGRLFRGEGIASIARGFTYAGARSLVATRWSVNDKTTSQLMGFFLHNIEDKVPKDVALQQAVLEYISKQNHLYAHPFYWSAFMAMGEMEPLEIKNLSEWPFVFIVGIALAGFFLLQRKNRVRIKDN